MPTAHHQRVWYPEMPLPFLIPPLVGPVYTRAADAALYVAPAEVMQADMTASRQPSHFQARVQASTSMTWDGFWGVTHRADHQFLSSQPISSISPFFNRSTSLLIFSIKASPLHLSLHQHQQRHCLCHLVAQPSSIPGCPSALSRLGIRPD